MTDVNPLPVSSSSSANLVNRSFAFGSSTALAGTTNLFSLFVSAPTSMTLQNLSVAKLATAAPYQVNLFLTPTIVGGVYTPVSTHSIVQQQTRPTVTSNGFLFYSTNKIDVGSDPLNILVNNTLVILVQVVTPAVGTVDVTLNWVEVH